MKLALLRPLRVGLALLSLALLGFLFLDLWGLASPAAARGLLFLQFAPSLLKFADAAAIGAAGFLVVLLLTALFGRVYCSALCPLGILQDAIGFLARKTRHRPGFRHSRPHNLPRYAILALTALLLAAGYGLLLNLLDPFSSFGRIMANLLRPLFLAANNAAAMALEPLGLYGLHQVQGNGFAPLSAAIALATLLLLLWLAARHGRLYCNTLCPVGALLGLVAKVPPLRLGFRESACKRCGLCEAACKAGCIDSRNLTLDFSRCVACYNCLAACKSGGLGFVRAGRKSGPTPEPDFARRDFMASSGVYLAGLAGAAEPLKKALQSRPTTIPLHITSPVSPPGSGSIARFRAICTACQLCVSACPSRVLAPAGLEYGFLGMMQPRLDFRAAHCNYECTLCTEICPSGALRPLGGEEKKRTQLGVARFIRENCVVYTDRTNCGACSEHCPTKAVDMVPFANPEGRQLVIPQVNPKICLGCGGCEHACPTRPYRAIYVDGNPVHKLAEKPLLKKLEAPPGQPEDFPF